LHCRPFSDTPKRIFAMNPIMGAGIRGAVDIGGGMVIN
jgi:hypothetical protein